MGLQTMDANWDPTHAVSQASIQVYDMWNQESLANQWDWAYLAVDMYRGMNLDSVVEDCRYRAYAAKVAQRTNCMLSIRQVVGIHCAANVSNFL